MTPYGWEVDYDEWLKNQFTYRHEENITVKNDDLQFFYENAPALPAFSEVVLFFRSFDMFSISLKTLFSQSLKEQF